MMAIAAPEDPLPRRADRDGARRRRQGQPPSGRRIVRAAAVRRLLREPLGDAAHVDINGTRIAITTDSFVVKPLRFPGGSIGELAVNGTVNDLAVSGARAEALVVTLCSRSRAADATFSKPKCAPWPTPPAGAGVIIAGGDTKVVEHGKADGMYITTAGIGRPIPGVAISPRSVRPGDQVLLSRPHRRSRHHDSAGARRSGSRSRSPLRHALGAAVGGGAGGGGRARYALDARSNARRRGHLAQRTGARLRPAASCFTKTGFRCTTPCAAPANCWGSIRCTSPTKASSWRWSRPSSPKLALDALQRTPGGEGGGHHRRSARAAGRPRCSASTPYGGTRVIDMLVGDPLPRIC